MYAFINTGIVPSSLKTASVILIIQTPGADPNNFHNLRSISNLPFSIIHSTHTTKNIIFYEQLQSGFRPYHSTDAALLKITDYVLMAAHSGLLTILILLDLSAAFNTISHNILLNR